MPRTSTYSASDSTSLRRFSFPIKLPVRFSGSTAIAFGEVETIQLLKQAGAKLDIQDAHGDTPLSWASWYGRPNPILRELLYGNFRIHPENQSMKANLIGKPLL